MLGANKSSGRQTQQPVRMPIAANATAAVGVDSGGLSTTVMEALFPCALTGRRNALDAARAGKKLAGDAPALAKRRFAAPIGADAAPRSRRIRRRVEAVPQKQFESQGGMPGDPADRSCRSIAGRSRRARVPACAEDENDVIRPMPAFGSRISDRAAVHTARKQAPCAAGCNSACPRNCNGFFVLPQLCHLAAATLTSFATRARHRTMAIRDATNT